MHAFRPTWPFGCSCLLPTIAFFSPSQHYLLALLRLPAYYRPLSSQGKDSNSAQTASSHPEQRPVRESPEGRGAGPDEAAYTFRI